MPDEPRDRLAQSLLIAWVVIAILGGFAALLIGVTLYDLLRGHF